jgi:hypothetical protein
MILRYFVVAALVAGCGAPAPGPSTVLPDYPSASSVTAATDRKPPSAPTSVPSAPQPSPRFTDGVPDYGTAVAVPTAPPPPTSQQFRYGEAVYTSGRDDGRNCEPTRATSMAKEPGGFRLGALEQEIMDVCHAEGMHYGRIGRDPVTGGQSAMCSGVPSRAASEPVPFENVVIVFCADGRACVVGLELRRARQTKGDWVLRPAMVADALSRRYEAASFATQRRPTACETGTDSCFPEGIAPTTAWWHWRVDRSHTCATSTAIRVLFDAELLEVNYFSESGVRALTAHRRAGELILPRSVDSRFTLPASLYSSLD